MVAAMVLQYYEIKLTFPAVNPTAYRNLLNDNKK